MEVRASLKVLDFRHGMYVLAVGPSKITGRQGEFPYVVRDEDLLWQARKFGSVHGIVDPVVRFTRWKDSVRRGRIRVEIYPRAFGYRPSRPGETTYLIAGGRV